ncbi:MULTISPECIES: Fic family protein [Microbacterium]|uniref:Fic family protein n=1 Tax=Microbacterium TaxID=33882 RepID=UPI001D179286|nr:Fic family protein [Microbacterium testaceum]MCC4249337.1 Fic family protein [Microbacterium testaceum]
MTCIRSSTETCGRGQVGTERVEPERIAVELRGSLDNIRYRWERTDDWTARELGIAVHAESVRIHGFVDGNGRTTRLLADLVFLAAQDAEAIAETYDWDIDKRRYIALLRQYDVTRDPQPLAEFVPVQRLDDGENR